MTITLIAPDGVDITAQQFRQGQAATYGAGFGRQLGGRSGFRVGTPSNVLTATDTTWTLGPCSAMLDPGASTHQGMYGWSTDANVTGAVTAADGTNPRKDIVYIQVNDSTAGDGSGAVSANVLYLAGTPGATPTAPALPARSFLVGTITVPQVGGGSPTVVLNETYYVAAGGRLPAFSAADRPSSPYKGQEVVRLDRNNHVQAWNGTAWKWVSRPEFYYMDAAGFSTTTSQASKLVATLAGVPTRTYATQVRVGGRISVGAGAISSGTLKINAAVSVVTNVVTSAQGKSNMTYTPPGAYTQTVSIDTGFLAVAASTDPLVRIWIEHGSGAVDHNAANQASSGNLWAEVLPADD